MTANEYISAGYNVIPVGEDKIPKISSWKEYQERMYEGEINGSLAVITGKISGNLEVLDFDNHDDKATERIKEYLNIPLVREIYEKYHFPVVKTQHGGYHIYIRSEEIEGNLKLAQVIFNGRPDTVIETRGEAGYVVAPPTKGYKLIRNSFHGLRKITKEERTILLEYAMSFNEFVKIEKKKYPKTDNGVKPWEFYDALPDIGEITKNILIAHGWQENNRGWIRPNKETKGISATFGKAAPNVFYVFSQNAYPFEEKKGYSPFAVKALLEYNGDFSECAKDIIEKYGLSHKKKEEEPEEIEKLFRIAKIDHRKEYKEPPIYLSITSYFKNARVCTPGNISTITGKGKSKKTFLLTLFMAACLENSFFQNRIMVSLPENKRRVVYFDTEQAQHDTARVVQRLKLMAPNNINYLNAFHLRGVGAKKMMDLLEYILKKNDDIGMVFLDQIGDFTNSINAEDEAVRVVRHLEKLTAEHDCHIMCLIHQNKADNYASGWLGSQLQKKSESVISVEKHNKVGHISIVRPYLVRNIEFDEFMFRIDTNNNIALPVIIDEEEAKGYETDEEF